MNIQYNLLRAENITWLSIKKKLACPKHSKKKKVPFAKPSSQNYQRTTIMCCFNQSKQSNLVLETLQIHLEYRKLSMRWLSMIPIFKMQWQSDAACAEFKCIQIPQIPAYSAWNLRLILLRVFLKLFNCTTAKNATDISAHHGQSANWNLLNCCLYAWST